MLQNGTVNIDFKILVSSLPLLFTSIKFQKWEIATKLFRLQIDADYTHNGNGG
jgi:hypothetical protein